LHQQVEDYVQFYLPPFDPETCNKDKGWTDWAKVCKAQGPLSKGVFRYDLHEAYRDWQTMQLSEFAELSDQYAKYLPNMDSEKYYSLLFSFTEDGHLMRHPRDTALYLARLKGFGVTATAIDAAERSIRRDQKMQNVVSKPEKGTSDFNAWVLACQERKQMLANKEQAIRQEIDEVRSAMLRFEDESRDKIRDLRRQIDKLAVDHPVPPRP
jgi:hypothetical protein